MAYIFFSNTTILPNLVLNTTLTFPSANLNFSTNGTHFVNFSSIDCTPISPFQSALHRSAIYLVYLTMFTISVIGNGCVCYVIIATPRMRTVTNYFIANLAVGEMLITLLCVPFTAISQIQQYWPFYNALCPTSAMAQAVSVLVSAYTLVAISIDRYIAIMWPLQPRMGKKAAGAVILGVWICASVTVMPIGVVTRALQPRDHYEVCDLYMCMEDWSDLGAAYANIFTRTLLMLQYVLPVSVLVFTYSSIGVVIWCHRIPGEAEDGRDLRIARSKRKMIKMMVAVVLVYTICWLPLNIYLLMHEMGVVFSHEENIWLGSHLLAMSHPCYNPVIYCYMNTRFRQGFAHIFWGRCRSGGGINGSRMRLNQRTIPLTSAGEMGSTVLRRNNTCTMYISTKRRNGSGGAVGVATKSPGTRKAHHYARSHIMENPI